MTPVLLDQFQRPLRNLRVSVTDRCNLRCSYCMPEQDYVWLPREDILQFEEIEQLVDVFVGAGRRQGAAHRRRAAAAARPSTARRGAGLASGHQGPRDDDQRRAAGAACAGAGAGRAASADCQPRYAAAAALSQLTRSDELAPVLEGIAAAAPLFPGLKIDTVVIRGTNDDELVDLIEFGRRHGAEVRFIEYMDVGGATHWSMERVVSRAEMLQSLARHYGPITPIVEVSSAPADRYRLPDGTVFGVIASTTRPFCEDCDRSRLTADGMWYLCLYAARGADLRAALRGGATPPELAALIRSIWEARRDRGAEDRLATRDRAPLIPLDTLRRDPHLEMHTRGG